MFDMNIDGRISRKEMTSLVKDLYSLLKRNTSVVAPQDTLADDAFEEMDKDGDGQVTEDEFIQSCLEQRDFSKMLALKVIDILVEDN